MTEHERKLFKRINELQKAITDCRRWLHSAPIGVDPGEAERVAMTLSDMYDEQERLQLQLNGGL